MAARDPKPSLSSLLRVKAEPELLTKLDAITRNRRTDRSELVRQELWKFVDSQDAGQRVLELAEQQGSEGSRR